MGLVLVLRIRVRVKPLVSRPWVWTAQGNHRAAVDSDAVGNHLVGPGPVSLRPEGVSVGRIGLECERALDGERGLHIASSCRGKERACPGTRADGRRASDNAFAAQYAGIHIDRACPSG